MDIPGETLDSYLVEFPCFNSNRNKKNLSLKRAFLKTGGPSHS